MPEIAPFRLFAPPNSIRSRRSDAAYQRSPDFLRLWLAQENERQLKVEAVMTIRKREGDKVANRYDTRP
jgi:hypothetical protein